MPNLLLADDKAVARRTMHSILADQLPSGMTYTEAENGLEAVEKAQVLHPDIVLLDLVMPQLNGLKAAQQIAEKCPETKVLVISMYDPGPLYDDLIKAGVRGFVPKSSLAVELVPAIEAVLDGKTFFAELSSAP